MIIAFIGLILELPLALEGERVVLKGKFNVLGVHDGGLRPRSEDARRRSGP